MNKKNRNIVLVLIAIIAISLIIFNANLFNIKDAFSVSGSSTLSLSQVSLQSTNPYLSGKAWLLTFSAGGLGQSYYGTITPSDIDAKTSDSTRTVNNLNIGVVYDDESCNYAIGNTGSFTPIYEVEQYTYTYIPLVAPCDLSTGSSKSGISQPNILGAYKPSSSFTCHIVYTTGQSPVGSMANGNVNAPYTITLNVNGNIATKKIDPLTGSSSGAIGNYAYANWNGNLVSGITCPASYDYRASYVNGNWRIIAKQSYDNFVTKWNTRVNLQAFGGDADVDNWVNDIKYYANLAKSTQSFGTIDQQSSLSNAVAKVSLSSPIQFPVTSIYIKADTLGIYTPVPNIGIISTSSGCFKTGENGVLSAIIKNTGDQGGTYRVYAQCNSPFISTQPATGSLNPGESRTINIPISATAQIKTTNTCTVNVETTGGTKSANANVCVDPQITCTIAYPQKFCGFSGNSEAIFQCSSNGATKNLIETCTANQYCDLGICKTNEIPDNGKSIWDLIKDFFGGIFNVFGIVGNVITILRWLVVVIATFISFFVFRDIVVGKIIKSKKDKIFAIIISLLLTLGIAIILYTIILTALFWWIIIGYILLLILIKFTGLGRIIKR